ncbi:MAG TPA: hypothetical protein VLG71_02635 [Candidatus Limnocylindria bacterium]|nr:hypothetical protein [Candidatus Limnocylindria bacterium]
MIVYVVSLLCMFTLFSHNAKAIDYQSEDDAMRSLAVPLQPTATGFANFLRNSYNQPEYTQAFLPNSFMHTIEFLMHGKKTQQTRAYTQSVVRLFANKLKGCTYVNAHALSDLLAHMPSLLEHHFLVQRTPDVHLLQTKINQLLYARFLDKFSEFKSSPNSFFNDLTKDILEALSMNTDGSGDISMEELRKTVLIFCEIALGKLIWSPEDQFDTWRSVKKIAEQLALFMDCNIIADTDDLNDLYVTLVERYCFFIDIAGHGLQPSFYENLQQELNTSKILLLSLEEQEDYLESKASRLRRTLKAAQAKHDADTLDSLPIKPLPKQEKTAAA